jgi:Nif-specific regulatory protein
MIDCLPKKYQFIKMLSANKNSTVICVNELQSKQIKVLKIISADSSFYSGILNEYFLMKQMHHPNLIETFEFGFLNHSAFYYEMLYFEQIDLHSHCKTSGQKGFLQIMQQILQGLNYLHERNLVHGDISLGNLLLYKENSNFKMKLSDFGLSSLIASQSIEEVSGTVKFMAPEMLTAKGKKVINVQSDIYALGMCLLSLVSKHKETLSQKPIDILKQKVQLRRTLIPKEVYVDDEIMTILKKMVAYDPAKRYQSVQEIYKDCLPLFAKDIVEIKPSFDFYPYREKVISRFLEKLNSHQMIALTGSLDEVLPTIMYAKAALNHSQKVCLDGSKFTTPIDKNTILSALLAEFPLGTKGEEIQNKEIYLFLPSNVFITSQIELDKALHENPNWKIILWGDEVLPAKIHTFELPSLIITEFEECLDHFLGKNRLPVWLHDFLIHNASGNYSLLKEILLELEQKNIIRWKQISWEFQQQKQETDLLTETIKNPYLKNVQHLNNEEKALLEKICFWKDQFTIKELSELFGYKIMTLQDWLKNLKKAKLLYQPSAKIKFCYAFQKRDILKLVKTTARHAILTEIVNFLKRKEQPEFEEIELLLSYALELDEIDVFVQKANQYLSLYTKENPEFFPITELFFLHRDQILPKYPDILLEKLNTFYYLLFQKRDVKKMQQIYDYSLAMLPYCQQQDNLDQFWVFSLQKLMEERKFEEVLAIYKQNDDRVNNMNHTIKISFLYIIADAYWEIHQREKSIGVLEDLLTSITDEQFGQKIFAMKRLGYYYTQFNQMEKALTLYRQGVELAEKCNAISETGHLFCLTGFILIEQYQVDEALSCFLKAKKIREEYKIGKLDPLIYWGFIPVYLLKGDFWKALQMSRLSKIHHHRTENIYFYDDLAGVIANLGYFDLAVNFYQQSVRIATEQNYIYSLHEFYTFLLEAIVRKKDYKKANEILLKLDEHKANTSPRILLYANYIKVLYYLGIHSYSQAKEELAVLESSHENFADIKLYFYYANFLYLKEMKDYATALSVCKKTLKKLESMNYHFVEAPEILYHGYCIQKEAFQQKLSTVDYKKTIIKAYEIVQNRAQNLPTNQMRRHFLQSDYRKDIIQAYETEITHSNYSELTSQLLNAIAEITNLIGTIRDKDKLLTDILNIALNVTKAERGILFTLLETSSEPKAEIVHHIQKEALQDIKDVNQKIIKSSFAKKKAVYHTEILSDNSFDAYQSYVNFSIQSIICLPLFIHGKMIGTVYLDSRSLLAFSPEEITFLNIFAQLAASAIETSQFYQKLQETNRDLSYILHTERAKQKTIIGNSAQIQEVIKKMEQIAPTDVNVLIQGESGTGKELIARGIHELSLRRKNTFIPVDCGSLSEDLIETELFGYKKGAFTGANYDKNGLFEEADRGTIFLDEIANLSLNTQTKLLRLLQEGELKRVGDTVIRKVNVRIVTASNIPLKQLVSENRFRQDLFYRLSIFPIDVPPLRQRKEDIQLLVHHFLQYFSTLHQKNIRGLKDNAIQILKNYQWPGNIRQLQNELERAVIVCSDAWLDESYFRHLITVADNNPIFYPIGETDFNKLVDEYKYTLIKKALECNDNNWSKAAEHLNISRQSMKRMYQRIEESE